MTKIITYEVGYVVKDMVIPSVNVLGEGMKWILMYDFGE